MRLGKGDPAAHNPHAGSIAMGERPLDHLKNGLKHFPFFSNMAGTLQNVETI
jgi:hypothetical protein